MDWFSWLSKTNLEPSLIYDYGLTFSRNELQLEDATYFNHELLQSMGVSIAKHRLEILKLVKKEEQGGGEAHPKKISMVIKRCLRKCMNKLVFQKEDVKKDTHTPVLVPEPNWYQGKWKGALVRKQGSEDNKEEKLKPVVPMHRSRTMPYSGPLDGRINEKINNKSLKLSGPIDGRMMYTNRSPLMARTIDGRFTGATTRSPRVSGPLDAKAMFGNRSPKLTRPLGDTDSRMGYYSPYNKPKADFDFDDDDDEDDHTLWPTLFQDLKPT